MVRITTDMIFVYAQEVVQRLFDDQEDEQGTSVTDKDPETPAEQPPVQATTVRSELKFKPYSHTEIYTE